MSVRELDGYFDISLPNMQFVETDETLFITLCTCITQQVRPELTIVDAKG